MKVLFYITFFSLGLFNSTVDRNGKYDKIAKAKWLIGNWGGSRKLGIFTENWWVKNDSTYKGISHFIMGKDTVFTENISLEQRGKEVNYITQIQDQNQGKPVAFKMTSASEKKLIFENPEHDFPQKITYHLKGNSLVAEASGKEDGKIITKSFPMERMK